MMRKLHYTKPIFSLLVLFILLIAPVYAFTIGGEPAGTSASEGSFGGLGGGQTGFNVNNQNNFDSFFDAFDEAPEVPGHHHADIVDDPEFSPDIILDGEGNDDPIKTFSAPPPNQAPVLNSIGNKVVNEGQLLQFTISGSDPDGSSLTFSASNLPSGASFSGQTFSFTPTFLQAGTYQVTFSVSDGEFTDSETITITVLNTNRAPTANNQNVNTNEDKSVTITLTGSDIDGDTLSFNVLTNPANGALTTSGTNVVYTPKNNFNGLDSFNFNVNDGTADSNAATVTINIAPFNSAHSGASKNKLYSFSKSSLFVSKIGIEFCSFVHKG